MAETGSKVTLGCILQTFDWCLTEAKNYGVHLSFLDEQGNELKSNRNDKKMCSLKYKASMQLIDPNTTTSQRTWTCQLTAGMQVQTSTSLTVRVKGQYTGHTFLVFIQVYKLKCQTS